MYYLQNLADFDFLPHDRLQLILLGNYRTTTEIRKEIRKNMLIFVCLRNVNSGLFLLLPDQKCEGQS